MGGIWRSLPMAKEVDKQTSVRYLQKAEEFYGIAVKALEDGKFDAATFNATQAVFLSNDAFCIYFLGRRASKDHREAMNLHVEAARMVSDTSKKSFIYRVFDDRSESGYTERSVKSEDARKMVLQCRRFIDWVRQKL